jgi:LysM repeat protein
MVVRRKAIHHKSKLKWLISITIDECKLSRLLTASAEINQFEALPSGRHVYLQGSNEGAYNPLTWEGMPLTLQIKFPHWKDQKLSSSPKVERKESTEKLQSPLLKKPVASNESLIPYIVMECDTLPSIALKFDVNQGEIARVNNKVLGSSCPIYPGELLYIPDIVRTDDKVEDDKGVGDEGREDSDNNKVSEDIVKDESVQGTLEASSFSDEEEVSPDFIRIKSKFIPEQICIQGSLWLNPQSLMFRPDPNDPLVEDHGIASYEVLIPLSEIVYAFFSFNYSSSDLLSPTATLTTTTASTTAATISPSPVTEDDKSPSLSRSSPPHDLSSPPLDDLSSPHDIESFPNDDDDDDQCFEHILDPDQGPPHESNSSSSNLDQNGSRSDIEEQYGDSPKSLSGPWRFLYVRVSQSAQQNQLTPIVGIEIPSHHKSSHELFAVRTWFIFAVPAVRLSDIHDFIFNYHPLAKSDDNLASLSAVSQATLTDSNRLEIVNIHGQYADDDLLVNEGHFSSSWEIFSVKDFQPVK